MRPLLWFVCVAIALSQASCSPQPVETKKPIGPVALVKPRAKIGKSDGKAGKPAAHWLAQLKNAKGEERQKAAQELGARLANGSLPARETENVVSSLMDLIEDPYPLVRRESVLSLAWSGSREKKLLAALQKATKDSESRVRVAANWALWRLTQDEAALLPIKAALKDKSPQVRWDAVGALSHSADKRTVAALVPLLQDRDREVRRKVGFALQGLCAILRDEAKEAVPALVVQLQSDDTDLRRLAAACLGGIGPEAKAALPNLVNALRNGDRTAWAIGRIGSDGKTVVPELAKALSHKEASMRMEAAYALGTIGAEAKSAISALQKASKDKNVNVRVAARMALWRAGGEDTQLRLAITDASNADFSALANSFVWLGSMGRPGVDVLVDYLKHPKDKVRHAAVFSLGSLEKLPGPPPKRAVPALLQILDDPDPAVRNSAARLLRAIDPEAAKKAGGNSETRKSKSETNSKSK